MASVITVAFENWKAQEAASGNAVLLDEFVFANVPNLDPTKPIDRNEKLPTANQIVHRQAVNKAGLASENAVAYSVTMGADVGNFDFNWIGLLNKASGTVAMITHAPTQKKLKNQNGQQGNVLTRSFILEFQGAAEETQIKTSAETWQIDFTARLSGIDEMQRLINVDSYGAAAFFNDGFEVTRSGEQYTVKKGLGYVGGLRGELAQNQILNGLRNTKVYADFSYQGNIVSQWNTVVKITSAATLNNYVDAAGFTHQVFAIASIDANGNITDLRPKGALIDQSLSALEKQLKLDLSKKIDKANITHQMGNSTELVVSQQLLATELGKKQPSGNYAPAGDYATNTALNNGLDKKLDKTGGVISGGLVVQSTVSANKKLEAFNNELETYALLDVTESTPKVKTKQKGMPFYDHKFPDKSGVFMHLGDYGWGGEGDYTNVIKEFSTSDELIKFLQGAPTQIWRHQNDIPDGKYSFRYGASFIIKTLDTFLNISSSFNSPIIRITTGLKGNTANWLTYDLLHTKNTTTDSGGFIRTGNATALTTGHVAQSTGTSTTNIMSQKATSDAIAGVKTLGDGQKWTDVKAQRQSGVTYTNTTGRTIALSVSTIGAQASSNVEIYVDNVLCSQNGFGGNANADFTRHTIGYAIIPTGSSYRVIASSLALWTELR